MPSGDLVKDVVIPLAAASPTKPKEASIDRLLGTGFIVGQPQRLITARHVVGKLDNVVGMRVEDGAWTGVGLTQRYDHPSEDISVYDLQEQVPGPEWFFLSAEEQNSSGNYSAWGYPEDLFYDHLERDAEGRVRPLPDLIYSAGHIRRRVSYSVPKLIGSAFYELSNVVGGGASGGPILTTQRGRQEVIGVYVGERTMQTGELPPRQIGYALRITAVSEWLRALGLMLVP